MNLSLYHYLNLCKRKQMSVSLWGSFILSALEVTDAYAIKRINIYHKNLVHINFTYIYVYIDSKYPLNIYI